MRVRCAKLFELPPQVLLLAGAAALKPLKVAERVSRARPGGMRGGDRRPQLRCACVGVEEIRLRRGLEQRVVLVLPVHRDQAAPELAQLARRAGAAVQPRRVPLADLALQHEL